MEIFSNGQWLPLLFAGLMGLSMLIYAVLDGYDLGVGILMIAAKPEEKDRMIGSIGPFWDANETWLVLGVGLLLVAFPKANGIILENLYLPVALMLMSLILRGVAFDFRAKAKATHKEKWNIAFFAGSLMASLAQGYMLGSYILGFQKGWGSLAFSLIVGVCLASGYCLIGACWLIMKTESILQKKSIVWARKSLLGTTIGIGLISLTTPIISAAIFDKWFSFPNVILLAPIPLVTVALIITLELFLRRLPKPQDRWCWIPLWQQLVFLFYASMALLTAFIPISCRESSRLWMPQARLSPSFLS